MNRFLRLFLLMALFAALIGAGRAFPALAQPPAEDFSTIDDYMTETMRRLPIKGMALAIVRGEQIIYMQGYGTANAQGDPATPQTPWRMGSVTKSFTALAVHQLAEQGKINLVNPVQKYLPEFRLADPRGGTLVTVRHLLDHTSGISEVEGNQSYLHSKRGTFEKSIERLAQYQPAYTPGEHSEYSNWNYVLLAQIVARASGQPFVEYVQENILDPLGMAHSTFSDPHNLPLAATGNLITYGISVPYDEQYLPNILGAGNLTSTAEDMAHFAILQLSRGTYQGRSLLRGKGQGWYGTMWDWASGTPSPAETQGLSGGYNSISATCLFYPSQKVGVVLLLNTRLDQLTGEIDSYQIARVIGGMVTSQPYQLAPYSSFYLPWLVLDAVFLVLIASLLWQVLHFKNWREQYRSGRISGRILAWLGLLFDLLAAALLLLFPGLSNTDWNSLLYHRPDFGIPLLILTLGHGAMGLMKIVLLLSPKQSTSGKPVGWVTGARKLLAHAERR